MSKFDMYINALSNVLEARKENEEDKDLIKKNVFYGVKLIKGMAKAKTYEKAVGNFQFASATEAIMGLLTPSEFMNVFPIEKDFKGYKYETKDYFYTRDYVNKLDQDKPIGKEITEFLWEYQNWDVTFFVIELMTLMSDIRRFEGKPSLAEEWANENGLKTYMLHQDAQGKEFLFDKETGKTTKVNKPRPKHLRLVN